MFIPGSQALRRCLARTLIGRNKKATIYSVFTTNASSAWSTPVAEMLVSGQYRSCKMTTLSDFTPRELEILQLLLAGKSNKAIAYEMEISIKTVEFHLDHIYTKLGARSRILAGIWALQNGLPSDSRVNPS